MKCFVMPVITGANGVVIKGLKKYLENNTKKAFSRVSAKKKKQLY
jgi:hypothetical protein